MTTTDRTSLQSTSIDVVEIEKAMARGRRERSLAFTSMIRSLFGGWGGRRKTSRTRSPIR